jgi:hypothetical protein
MTNLRLGLEQEVRNFLQNEIDFGTRKQVDFDPETLVVVDVSDTGKPYELAELGAIGDFLRLTSRLKDGRVYDLGHDLLTALRGYAQGKCLNPADFARQTVTSLSHLSLQKFLAARPANTAPRERRLRARMQKLGYKVVRSRSRNPRSGRYGTYIIQLEATGEIVVVAPSSLEGLEQWSPE